MLTVSRKTFL